MIIKTVSDFNVALSMYSPYGIYFVTTDGGCLCDCCAKKEKDLVESSISENVNDGWLVLAAQGCNIDPDTTLCDNCGKDVSVYL